MLLLLVVAHLGLALLEVVLAAVRLLAVPLGLVVAVHRMDILHLLTTAWTSASEEAYSVLPDLNLLLVLEAALLVVVPRVLVLLHYSMVLA